MKRMGVGHTSTHSATPVRRKESFFAQMEVSVSPVLLYTLYIVKGVDLSGKVLVEEKSKGP